MTFTKQLKREHETIEVMLAVLEKICMQIEGGEEINSEHLEKVIEFLSFFADKCHNKNEEHILFPAIEKSDIPEQRETINAMLLEHNKSHYYITKLEESLEHYKTGNKEASSEIISYSRKYIELLVQHIYNENNILFIMAEEQLSEEENKEMMRQFEEMEKEKNYNEKHNHFYRLMVYLKDFYLGEF